MDLILSFFNFEFVTNLFTKNSNKIQILSNNLHYIPVKLNCYTYDILKKL